MKYGVIEFECHSIEYHDTVHNAEEVLSKEQVMSTTIAPSDTKGKIASGIA